MLLLRQKSKKSTLKSNSSCLVRRRFEIICQVSVADPLGELPTNTPIPKASSSPSWWPWSDDAKKASEAAAYRAAVLDSQSSTPNTEASYLAENDENAKFYPLPLAERMEAAQFAARMRAAERAHESEEAARQEGSHTATEMLARRMERAYEGRAEGVQDKKIRVANKNKIRKDAAAAESHGEELLKDE